jgi:hypothetical protein
MEDLRDEKEKAALATRRSPFFFGVTAMAVAVPAYALMDAVVGKPIDFLRYSMVGLIVFTVVFLQEKLSTHSYR